MCSDSLTCLTTRPTLFYSVKQTVSFCTEQLWLWQILSYIKRSHLFCDCFVVLICPPLGWQTIHLKFIIYFSYFSKQIDWWPTFRGLLCEVSHLHAHEPKRLQLLWDCHFLIHFCVFTNPHNTLPMFLRRSIILTYLRHSFPNTAWRKKTTCSSKHWQYGHLNRFLSDLPYT